MPAVTHVQDHARCLCGQPRALSRGNPTTPAVSLLKGAKLSWASVGRTYVHYGRWKEDHHQHQSHLWPAL